MKAAVIALKRKTPIKTHNLKRLYSEVAEEIALTDEQVDFLAELTPASQTSRYVDAAVGIPREIYSSRLLRRYSTMAIPIFKKIRGSLRG